MYPFSISSPYEVLSVNEGRERKLCHMFSESPDIYSTYLEEFRDARTLYKDSPEILGLLLEFSSSVPPLFDRWKSTFLDMYVKSVLNTRDKLEKGLSEAFVPLFTHLPHEDLKNVPVPSSVKMLKRNPELVLESVGVLLKSVNLDLSKYATEILVVVLPQARHADEGRRLEAFSVLQCLSQKSSNPDAVEAMFPLLKLSLEAQKEDLHFHTRELA